MTRPLRLLPFAIVAMRLLPAFLSAGAMAAEAAPAACRDRTVRPRHDDQVWLISTRCLGYPPGDANQAPQLGVWLRDSKGVWRTSSVADFLAAQSPERRVLFQLHGARTTHGDAALRGHEFYQRLSAAAPQDEPLNFVIWSWPTSPAGRPLRDLRSMASRSDVEAYYLAWLLARLDPDTRIDLHGFSYGGRAATGAMHLLAGGRLLGRTIPRLGDTPHTSIDVVLWTPALNNDWLVPGRYHGQAVDCMDRMLIVYNPCDFAMKHYHLVVCGRAQGLGYTGLWGASHLGAAAARIEAYNGSGQLGKEHSFLNYMYSTKIMQMTQAFVFAAPASAPAAQSPSVAAPRERVTE